MKLAVLLGVASLFVMGCSGSKPKTGGSSDGDGRQGKAVDTSSIYGKWQGAGQAPDRSHTYVQTFVFSRGQVSVTKTCQFAGKAVSVGAASPTEDDPTETRVVLTGALSGWETRGSATCAVDFPLGLEFVLQNGRLTVGLRGSSKETALKKISDL